MYGEVQIGERTIEMLANAATPYYYNQIFHADFFTESQDMGEANGGLTVSVFTKLAFIMAKQAEKKDMAKINEGQFIKWLSDFEPMDIPNAMPEIVDIYMGNTKGTASPKK